MDTKDKILDSAQRLIGDQGFAATSVRHIIADARVNLAAIHYHFGTKEDLLDAVIARKVGPVNEERLRLLEQVEAEAGSGPLAVKKVLESWLQPMAEAADRDPSFVRFMGRMMAEGMLPMIVERHFKKQVDRLLGAMRRALPELPEEEFLWRTHFMSGAIAQTMCGKNEFTGLGGDMKDFRTRIDRLITFLTAAFEAPATAAAQSGAHQ
jgi:AcrR family transcriptional regulator